MSLLEFLADPYEFQKFEKVSKTISRYVAKHQEHYKELVDRFFVLTGKRSDSGEITGYRTQIVHLGKRLEDILPAPEDRQSILRESQEYIRCVIRHMIEHSEMVWDQYIEHRNRLDAYLQSRHNQREL